MHRECGISWKPCHKWTIPIARSLRLLRCRAGRMWLELESMDTPKSSKRAETSQSIENSGSHATEAIQARAVIVCSCAEILEDLAFERPSRICRRMFRYTSL